MLQLPNLNRLDLKVREVRSIFFVTVQMRVRLRVGGSTKLPDLITGMGLSRTRLEGNQGIKRGLG